MMSERFSPPWLRVFSDLNEAQRRWLAGAMALQEGWGGIRKVQNATGLSAPTIIKGMREVRSRRDLTSQERLRPPGAGRKPVETTSPPLLKNLNRLVEESAAGDPMSSLRWVHKSTRTLAQEMTRQGHSISHVTVGRLLSSLGYSLQVNAKSKEGRSPETRDAQFRYINQEVEKFQEAGNPVLSIDAKKKEKVGSFKNAGRTYRPKGQPVKVNVYDYPALGRGVAIPYGAYDVGRNHGFVNVGMTYETAEFAVESLRWWWRRIGRPHYPKATGWLLCADGGGSNGSRRRGWKYHLQTLTNEIGIPVTVCHYPPGTSKWNKIEHQMFSFISLNWQGVPLENYATVVNLIGATRTRKGLRVQVRLDRRDYELCQKIGDQQMAQVQLRPHETHPQWNYTILPEATAR
jgi:transposase